ncbi:DHA2 family efflux MFS transporter permease subunit [Furfurilactobacillus siliginis]|uniref:MFS transporter n=1 Tax=Furfurilactobacillus siliginis TaxID=348151 RepID=A0A0R2L6B0_9LACO|nr:DHA2 family efflux MFS transporter permease subunit [Furfurilactobacillus siliginis]KRN97187.1 transporter, major facilitator family protein [Furfurilactobacillus siliginis]GEK28649.1 MFS transporter [Furfurilactobacillus siliginis]
MEQAHTTNRHLIAEIFAIGLLGFLGIVIETALNIAFPLLSDLFHVTPAQIQWLTTGYMIVSTILIPLSVFLRKRFSVITLFRFSVIVFSLGTLLAAISSNYAILLCARLLQGVSNGIALPLMFSVILQDAPRKQLGRMIGLGSLVIAFAPAIGPVFGGLVQTYLSWRAVFWLALPLMLVAWLLGEFSIPRAFTPTAQSVDLLGASLLGVFLVTSMLVIVNISAGHFTNRSNLIEGVLAILTLIAFIVTTRRAAAPLLDLRLFHRSAFTLCLVAFFLLQCLSLSMSYLIPNVLQLSFHSSPNVAGLLVLPAALIDAIMSAIAGYVYDKTPARLTILGGATLILIVFIGSFFSPIDPMSLAIIYAIFMLGLGACYANIMTYSLGNLPQSKTDDGNAIFMTAQAYAGAVGIALAASLVSFAQTAVPGRTLATSTLAGLRLNNWYLVITALLVLILLIIGIRPKNWR